MAGFEKINIDVFSRAPFSDRLQSSVEITQVAGMAANLIHKPQPWDRIQIDLLDDNNNEIRSVIQHIEFIPGIIYKNGYLNVDTFSILTQTFNITTGNYSIRISGFRNFIYTFNTDIADDNDIDDIVIEGPDGSAPIIISKDTDVDISPPAAPVVDPNNVFIRGLEIIEISRERNEIRVKAKPEIEDAFNKFIDTQTPRTIPLQGKYWMFEYNDNVTLAEISLTGGMLPGGENASGNTISTGVPQIYFSIDGTCKVETSHKFESVYTYDKHRKNRGLNHGSDNPKRYQGIHVIRPAFSTTPGAPSSLPGSTPPDIQTLLDVGLASDNFAGYYLNTPNGGRIEAQDRIWPLHLRVNRPGGGGFLDLIGTNWMENMFTPTPGADKRNPLNQQIQEPFNSIIFKLAVPAPSTLAVGQIVQLMRPLFIPFEIPVTIDIPYEIDIIYEQLRGPNLRIGKDNSKLQGRSTTIKSSDTILGSTDSIKARLENNIISGSGLITTNVDFRKFNNFVHFSSAEERLKNFKYKLTRLEHYASKSYGLGLGFAGSDGSVTGSSTAIQNKSNFDKLHNSVLSSFNPYENYLYYTSHSTETVYESEGEVTILPASWPKSTSTKTGAGYTLLSVSSSEATTWYNSQIVSASLYDQTNPASLRNIIPTHIRVESSNDSYQLFFDMIGEHFDELYLHIKRLEESYGRDESVNVGVSKDLLFDVAKSFGWDLHPGFSSADLWDYALGTDDQGTYQASGSGDTLTFVVKESHSSEDIEKQTWKRILNNLPLLMKTKGTARGIKALLNSYGVPLTILNINEYGGAPVTRTEDKRSIQKFAYGVDFSGSSYVETVHGHFSGSIIHASSSTGTINSLTTQGSDLRTPSMYEVRIDTSKQQDMYIARSSESAGVLNDVSYGPKWQVILEHSHSAAGWDSTDAISAGSASAYAQYGRLVFEISASEGQAAISASTEYLPIFDNDWWNVSFGVEEYPYGNTAIAKFPTRDPSAPESQSFTIRCSKAAEWSEGRITHSSSATVVGNSSSYSMVWSNPDTIIWGNQGPQPKTGSSGVVESYSGSMQEIRGWAEYLDDDTFHTHTLSPISVVGTSVEMAYNDLLIRLPLGTDNRTPDITSSNATVTSSLPNTNNLKHTSASDGEGGLFNGFTGDPYAVKSETYFVKVPHTAGPSRHANKIRIEDNTLRNNQLARDKSYEQSSFDSNPLDSEDVDVVLSPADQIDTDIAMQFGAFDLDDYIGDPRDTYKLEYTSLRHTNNLYFKKYTGGTNVAAFIKYLRSFNKGLFKQIEDMIPARADAVVGVDIRPNILERHKIAVPVSASREIVFYTGSIAVATSSAINGSLPSSQTYFNSELGTLSALIGIGAPPSRQRSGSNDYFNLYEGSNYINNVFGEATESATQITVSQSSFINKQIQGANLQIPTFNKFNKPHDPSTNQTGSGWITVYEETFGTFTASISGTPTHFDYPTNVRTDTWRIMDDTAVGDISIVGGALQVGNNSGNDEAHFQWNNPLPYQPNTLYRMTVKVITSADTNNDNSVSAGFALFTDAGQLTGSLKQIIAETGEPGTTAVNFVASAKNLATGPGLSVPYTASGYASNITNLRTSDNGSNDSGFAIISNYTTPAAGTFASASFTHFAPSFILNASDDDGTTQISSLKVEALPGAFVDVTPNYESSNALRRLLINGTRMQSGDWNVSSTDTIDGGPVAAYDLVNPNIINVNVAPTIGSKGGGYGSSTTSGTGNITSPATNLKVN